MITKDLSIVQRQLLSLLASGLGFASPEARLFEGVDTDWQALRHEARRQTVEGIVYDGLIRLPVDLRPPRQVLLSWYARVVQIEQANHLLDEALCEVVSRYRAAGLHPVLLKGQGVAQYYPQPSHRQSGDIDLYFLTPEGYARANAEAARWEGVQFHPDTSYHRAFTWRGVEVENHLKYADFYHPRNHRRWLAWQQSHALLDGEKLRLDKVEIDVPSPPTNAVYLFMHLQHHFLQAGVGLRQVCDWLCLLRRHASSISRDAMAETWQQLPQLRRSMQALGKMAVTYLSFPEEFLPFALDGGTLQADARLMLDEIFLSGNFAHDTTMMQSFDRSRFWSNLPTYYQALRRYMRIFRLCPSEIGAYPFSWLRSKVGGG